MKMINKKYVSVKYDGKLEVTPASPNANLPRYHNQFKQLYPYYRRDDDLYYQLWLKKQREECSRLGLPESTTVVNASSNGEQIFIDAPAKVMSYTGVVRCLREQGVNDRFPPHFKTDIYLNGVEISERDFPKYFTIDERIVWTCRYRLDSFYRIETEFVSNNGVENVFFDNRAEIQYIYSIVLPDGVIGVRFREVRYFDSSAGRPIKFIEKKNQFGRRISIRVRVCERSRSLRIFFINREYSKWEENNDQSSGFLRVVNKLKILTPEVRYMETFDGVSIIKDETDLRVIEIKYLDLNNPDEVVKYGGKLVFDDKDKENVKSTYSKGIKSIQKTIDDTAAFIGGNSYSPRSLQMRDYDPLNLVPTGGGQTKSEKTINFKPSTDGIQITMDITPTLTELITFNEVIECEFLANEKMHPVVKISIKKSRASETREEQIGMKENYKQSKYFKWVVREVWQCKIPNQVEPIRRIVTEQHLIKDANKFIYDPILSKVWVELVAEKTILKIKDVRYWNPSNQHTIYLNASISLAEREVKLKSEFWMSGNMPFNGLENLGGGNAVLQDIWLGLTLTEQEGKDKKTVSRNGPEYKYPLKRISYPDSIRTVTFEKGSRVFQIGSKASSEIPASTQIWCDIENSRDSKSLLDYVPRVIEYIDGEMFLLDIDLLKDAFTIMKKEVWTCSNGQKSITRIDTIMCAQDPIHAVRSLGGVEVDSFVFIEQVSSAAVTETIYILDGKIVKYGGTPSSKSPPSKV
ncbi:uncharacterized protein LOC111059971 isoform X4 [Nilaparvata lugens]|uniref:uncharacterized protein LOC111059971 isoform X4 n=1 Tax=Nilaparvata lugens TaxID=108931 RepID=UPI00193E8A40|nr:uncharacterized protein LOC111059971 isoform X4 [Nilaparvata lugens]